MIHPMKSTQILNRLPLAALAFAFSAGMSGAAPILFSLKTDGREIPDNDSNGLASVLNLSTGGELVGLLEVGLDITGGWNSDYYAYLQHGNGVQSVMVVLLNRPGVSVLAPGGAESSGMSLTLADGGPFDIHSGIPMNNGDVVAGRYQPDGRLEDPQSVSQTSPRTTFLADFNGASADGDWTLFIADQGGGEVGQLTTWSMNMVFAGIGAGGAAATPEPEGFLLAGVPGLLGAGALLRRRVRPSAGARQAHIPCR